MGTGVMRLASALVLLGGCAGWLGDTPPPAPTKPYAGDLAKCEAGQRDVCRELLRYPALVGDDIVLPALEKLCELDDGDSCRVLAMAVPDRRQRGAALMWKACKLGSADACFTLEMAYSMGNGELGLTRDVVRAVDAAVEACLHGADTSCWPAIDALASGTCVAGVGDDCHLVVKDPERVDVLLRRLLCAGQSPAACDAAIGLTRAGAACPELATPAARLEVDCHVLNRTRSEKAVIDAARALPYLTRACAGGEATACVAEADLRWAGRGAPVDRDGAVSLLEKGCAAGAFAGCFRLGRIALARKDALAAVASFARAAAAAGPHAAAIQREAGMYLACKGHVVEADPLLAPACAAGDHDACDVRGRALVIAGRNLDEAVTLLTRVCDNDGVYRACRALSHVYARRHDAARARKYYALGQPERPRFGPVAKLAMVLLPPLAILALPRPAQHGYGFHDELSCADP